MFFSSPASRRNRVHYHEKSQELQKCFYFVNFQLLSIHTEEQLGSFLHLAIIASFCDLRECANKLLPVQVGSVHEVGELCFSSPCKILTGRKHARLSQPQKDNVILAPSHYIATVEQNGDVALSASVIKRQTI